MLTSEYPSMQIGQLTVPEGLQSQGFTSGPAHAAPPLGNFTEAAAALGAPSDSASAQTLGDL